MDDSKRWMAVLRDLGVALFAGLLILIATPPLSLWPAGIAGLAILYVRARDAAPLRAAAIGWACGFVVNAAGFAWGADLLERFVHLHWLFGTLWVIALAAYQAVVFALWLSLATWLHRRWSISCAIGAPLSVLVIEAAVPFIFPWYLALIAAPAWPLLQVAELGGPPAVSALLVLVAVIIGEAFVWWRAGRSGSLTTLRFGALAFTIIFTAGLVRAWQIARMRHDSPQVRVAIVQPDSGLVSPKERAQRGDQLMRDLRNATADASRSGADLVVWPESAFPFLFDRDLKREFAPGHPWELHPGHQGALLFGALSHQFGTSTVRNSAVLATSDGRIAGIYDKTHLLAFGEYIPFADRFPEWAKRMRARMADWPEIVAGNGPALLIDGPLRIAPLICYEDLLPEYVYELSELHPNLLVTSANHAWFGSSKAPRQAQALAILRGVETRRDMVRATTTGVSSISDALGRVGAMTTQVDAQPGESHAPQVVVGQVALLQTPALAGITARWIPYACAALLIGLIVLTRPARRDSSGAGQGHSAARAKSKEPHQR